MPDDHHDHMVDVDSNEVIEFVDEEIEARQLRSPPSAVTKLSITHWCFTFVKGLNKLESQFLPGAFPILSSVTTAPPGFRLNPMRSS